MSTGENYRHGENCKQGEENYRKGVIWINEKNKMNNILNKITQRNKEKQHISREQEILLNKENRMKL